MRVTALLAASTSLVPTLAAQEQLRPGPYAPPSATSVVFVDLAGLRDSVFGKRFAAAKIGKAFAKSFKVATGYDWTQVRRLDLASAARSDHGVLQPIWVVHARGTKAMVLPKLFAAYGIDLRNKREIPPGFAVQGFLQTAPRELLWGDARYLYQRIQGKKLGATVAPAIVQPGSLIRAEITVPRVGPAVLGNTFLPLLDGVSYAKDPVTKILFTADRSADGEAVDLRLRLRLDNCRTAGKVVESLREQVARALRSPDYHAYYPALAALNIAARGRPEGVDLTLRADRKILDTAFGGWELVASMMEHLAKFTAGAEKLGEKKVIKMEPIEEAEEIEEEIPPVGAKKVRRGPGKKKKDS